MITPQPKFLLATGLFALPAAALAETNLPVAAAIAATGALFAVCAPVPWRRAGMAALPAVLAGLGPTAEPLDLPRPGPVRVRGVVAETVHDPKYETFWIRLRAGSRSLGLACAAPFEAVPGDRIDALAHLSSAPVPDLDPTLQATAANVETVRAPPSLPRLLHRTRAACERQLLRLLPDERGATVATLVLGRATRAPEEIARAHRATGLSHLLAVSGAHAALLGLMLGLGGYGRGRRLGTGRRHLILALLILFVYAGITGAEPPVIRAVVMYSLAALAVQTGRPLTLLAGLMVPALITAVSTPGDLTGPSFLLSYAAVFGLSLARGESDGPFSRWVLLPLRASFWATCTTAPLTLCWFGQIAPWTILLTPLLAPMVALLLLLGLGAAVTGCIAPPFAAPFGPALGVLAELYLKTVEFADELPFTPLRAQCVPPAWLLGLTIGASCLTLLCWRRRAAVAAAVALFAAPWMLPLPLTDPARLVLLAVGHGQACLVETAGGSRFAIDCGSTRMARRAARVLAEHLSIRRLDWLVITHADHDHHSGVPALLQRVRIARAALPASLRDSDLADRLRRHGAELHALVPGARLRATPELMVGAPLVTPDASSNERSLWVRVETDGTSALLTGDAGRLGVDAAIAQGLATPSTLLVLPHHGRPNPAATALLSAVRPVVCFASAARPDGETALGELARRAGADLWVTGQHGHLQLTLGPEPSVTASEPGRPLRRDSDTNLVHRLPWARADSSR